MKAATVFTTIKAMKKWLRCSKMFLLCTDKTKIFSVMDCTSCKTMYLINNAFYWKGVGGLLRYYSSLSVAVINSVACFKVSMTLFIFIFQSRSSGLLMFKEELARDSSLLVSLAFCQCVFLSFFFFSFVIEALGCFIKLNWSFVLLFNNIFFLEILKTYTILITIIVNSVIQRTKVLAWF